MATKVALQHITHYRYEKYVKIEPHLIRLRPAPHCATEIINYNINIYPEKHFINWQQDPFSNYIANIVFLERTKELKVSVDLIANLATTNPFDFFLEEDFKTYPFVYTKQQQEHLLPYMRATENSKLLWKWLKDIDTSDKRSTLEVLIAINKKITDNINYTIRLEPGVQSAEQTLQKKTGSCRDMAWLLAQTLRHLGFAVRFVSGYLVQLKIETLKESKDITDLHAWLEVYLPGAGWLGLDPTSGLLTGEGHIPLCCTPQPINAAPISGCVEKCTAEMSVHMDIIRLHEDFKIDKPYTKEQWSKINNLGNIVEEKLLDNDIRLTFGGEPTFVAIDNCDDLQWKTAALGKQKKDISEKLLRKLKKSFKNTKNGLILERQGKYYAGEELPRWSLDCYWRCDQEPIWENDDLLISNKNKNNYSLETAKLFITTLAKALQLGTNTIITAINNLDNPQLSNIIHEQATITSNFINNTDYTNNQDNFKTNNVGYILPILWSSQRNIWLTSDWQLPNRELCLLKGSIPIGYRIPIDKLPNVADFKEEAGLHRSLFAEDNKLLDHTSLISKIVSQYNTEDVNYAIGSIHTAICVEIFEDKLQVFLPPQIYLETFLELIAAIEWVSNKLQIAIKLVGYGPPTDNRLSSFSITPDPGVIEVNVHPVSNWQDLVNNTSILYEKAKECGLRTEKFMIDGQHIGTGGGNHLVLGGKTPTDSPFLRRPDLLKSFILFWQNNPSLSYLFTGLFLGPTSQAPRVDEGRADALYELEIALKQIPVNKQVPFWLVDRLLRNILVDTSGNTHRAEFCIDKLYSPNTEFGRQGLVELRAFEMTPHIHMNLLQALLIRACVVFFWEKPFDKPIVKWDTQLHDKFMLPHFIWNNFQEVIQDLNIAGLPFNIDWFKPFLEFTCPKYCTFQVGDIKLEIRKALEPWPILGEENIPGGTSRGVDSAVERLQLRVFGLNNSRYVVICNNIKIPLHATKTQGEYVAGIRYKAWAPPFTLHPNLPINSPLIFQVVDIYNNRSIGGCTYNVMHPGGANRKELPCNAKVAETRRLERISYNDGLAGEIFPKEAIRHPDFPYTLDMRIN